MTREVYILLGQSNMLGRGSLTPAPTYTNISRIWTLPQPWHATYQVPCDDVNPGGGTWTQGMVDPIHSGGGAGVGPGLSFADRLITLRGDSSLEIGLVPCAWSGSQVCSMYGAPSPGAPWDSAYRCWNPFGMAAARMNAAKAWGPIKGALIRLGETDAMSAYGVSYFHREFGRLIRDIRITAGDLALPFVVSRLGPDPADGSFPSWGSVQSIINDMRGIDPHIRIAEACDLPASGYHHTTAGCLSLGQRMADAMVLAQGVLS